MRNNFLDDSENSADKQRLEIYLNGMLSLLEILNDDHAGHLFYFHEIKNCNNDYKQSVLEHLQYPEWQLQLNEVTDFEMSAKEAFQFFGQYRYHLTRPLFMKYKGESNSAELDEQVSANKQFIALTHCLHDIINRIVGPDAKVYEVVISGDGWYEASYKDYFFDSKGVYYFFHIGVSD